MVNYLEDKFNIIMRQLVGRIIINLNLKPHKTRSGILPTKRGFSTIETVVALSIFLGVIATVSITALQLSSTLVRAEIKQESSALLGKSLTTLSRQPFSKLIAENYNIPSPCPGSQSRSSCFNVNGTSVKVVYSTTLGPEVLTGPEVSSDAITIEASATLDSGETLSRTKSIPAPAFGLTSSTAVLRVRSLSLPAQSGEVVDLPALYLLDRFNEPVTNSSPFSNSLAIFRTSGEVCTLAQRGPCHIGVRVPTPGDPSYWTTAGYTLAPPDILGPGASLTLSSGSFTETSVLLAPVADAKLYFLAKNPQNRAKRAISPPPANTAGSVCLWGTFDDGSSLRSAPYCNDSNGVATVNGFTDPTTGLFFPFPNNFQVSLGIDPPLGTCPGSSSYPASSPPSASGPNGFYTAAECSSWTWGTPTQFGKKDSATDSQFPVVVTLDTSTSNAYDVVYAGDPTTSSNWAQVSIGSNSTCAVALGGTLWCWGATPATGLSTPLTAYPTKVGSSSDWEQIAVGAEHACGLKQSGALFCWGSNSYGATGQETFSGITSVPLRVGADTYTSLTVGLHHTCAVSATGALVCFGDNSAGQLGAPINSTPGPVVTNNTNPENVGVSDIAMAHGFIWVTDTSANTITRYSPAFSNQSIPETPQTYTVPSSNSGVNSITAGPDGSMYFTETNTNKIGKLSKNGVITEFLISTPNSGPTSITSGPAGNIYFTETAANKIGWISTATNAISDIAIPTSNSNSTSIVSGPDNAVYFTETTSNKVGKFTPCNQNVCSTSGTFLEFNFPNNDSPSELTVAADGNIWVLAPTQNKVVSFTTGGSTNSYSLPANTSPAKITAASDGAVYVASSTGSGSSLALTRISPDGLTTNYTNPANTAGGVTALVSVGDGKMYFSAADTIGVISLVTATPQDVNSSRVWSKVDAGKNHTCGLTSQSGNLFCFGDSTFSQTGVSPKVYQGTSRPAISISQPTQVPGTYQELTAGGDSTCAVKSDAPKNLVCFGSNKSAQLAAVGTFQPSTVYNPPENGTNTDIIVDTAGDTWTTLNNSLLRISDNGQQTAFLVSATAIADLALGPDGNIYFPDGDNVAVFDIPTTSRTATWPGPGGELSSVATGNDRQIWVTGPSLISKFNLSGDRTDYALPSSKKEYSTGITPGPPESRTMYFTETATNKIGRITSTGAVTEWVIPTAASGTKFLVNGPDDLIYFTETASNKIGILNPTTGTFQEVSAGITPNAGLARLYVLSDGAVWFIEKNSNKLATINKNNIIYEAADNNLSSFSNPSALAQDLSGILWIAGGNTGRTVKATLSSASTTVSPAQEVGYSKPTIGEAAACALTPESRKLFCWGAGNLAQSGYLHQSPTPIPTMISENKTWTLPKLGLTTQSGCAIEFTGSMSCFGSNEYGTTGLGLFSGITNSPSSISSVASAAQLGSPATGTDIVASWEKPRSARSCVSFSTCTTVGDSVPERLPSSPALCLTDIFCYSSVNSSPRLVSPGWPYSTRPSGSLTNGSTNNVNLTFIDSDSPTIFYTLVSAPTHGILRSPGGILDLTSGSPAISAFSGVPSNLVYVPNSSFTGTDSFTLSLTDGTSVPYNQVVSLYQNPTPILIEAGNVQAYQTKASNWPVEVTLPDGYAASNVALTLTTNSNTISFSNPSTNSSGVATVNISTGSTPAGNYLVTAAAPNGLSVTRTLTVLPTPSSIDLELTSSVISQSGNSLANVVVRDVAGSLAENQLVTFKVLDATGHLNRSIKILPASCLTNSLGSCSTILYPSVSSPPLYYSLVASVSSNYTSTITDTQNFNIAPSPSSLRVKKSSNLTMASTGNSPTLTVDQTSLSGVSVTVQARAKDGTPVPGVSIIANSEVAGLGISSSGNSDAAGLVYFTVTTNSVSLLGSPTITFTSSGITPPLVTTLLVKIKPVPSTISTEQATSYAYNVPQGSSIKVPVTVKDANGNAISGAVIKGVYSGGDNLRVAARTTTNQLGVGNVVVTAQANSREAPYTITLTSGAKTITVPVVVTSAPARVFTKLQKPLFAGNTSSSIWSVYAVDANEDAIPGLYVTASCIGCGINFISSNSTTNNKGIASFSLSTNSPPPTPGWYSATINVSGVNYPTRIKVSPTPTPLGITSQLVLAPGNFASVPVTTNVGTTVIGYSSNPNIKIKSGVSNANSIAILTVSVGANAARGSYEVQFSTRPYSSASTATMVVIVE